MRATHLGELGEIARRNVIYKTTKVESSLCNDP